MTWRLKNEEYDADSNYTLAGGETVRVDVWGRDSHNSAGNFTIQLLNADRSPVRRAAIGLGSRVNHFSGGPQVRADSRIAPQSVITSVEVNGTTVWRNGMAAKSLQGLTFLEKTEHSIKFSVAPGTWFFTGKSNLNTIRRNAASTSGWFLVNTLGSEKGIAFLGGELPGGWHVQTSGSGHIAGFPLGTEAISRNRGRHPEKWGWRNSIYVLVFRRISKGSLNKITKDQ